MGRLPRIYVEGVLYYVTSNSIHGEKLFVDEKDYQVFLSLIGQCKRKYGFKLFAYLILPHKTQLVIELKNNIPISEIMYSINSRYTKRYNFRHNKKGSLLQNRFKLRLVEKEGYILPLIRDMLLEPVRLGIVRDLADYPYSSYSYFTGSAKKPYPELGEEREELLTGLGRGVQEFEDYIQSKDRKEIGEFRKKLERKRIAGSPDFINQIKEKIKEKKEKIKERKTKSLSKRTKIILGLAVLLVILAGTVMIRHFYIQTVDLEGKYKKTRRLYLHTLEELKEEQSKVAGAGDEVGRYKWKIRLVENALEKLQQEMEEALRRQKGFENYRWEIKLDYRGGHQIRFPNTDIIRFSGNRLSSRNFAQRGFRSSTYSKRSLNKQKVEWTTTQRNSSGDTVSWKGVYSGETMKGAFSWQPAAGKIRNFSFVSTNKKLEK